MAPKTPKPSADKVPPQKGGAAEKPKKEEKDWTSIFNIFGDVAGEKNPLLDKAREGVENKLNELQKQGRLKDVAANVYEAFKIKFVIDLNELGKTEAQQKPYFAVVDQLWNRLQKGRKTKEIKSSDEFKNLTAFFNDFIKQAEELEPIAKAIEDYKPESGLDKLFDKLKKQFPDVDWETYKKPIAALLAVLGLDKAKKKPSTTASTTGAKPKAKPKATPEIAKVTPEKLGPTGFFGDSIVQGIRTGSGGDLKIKTVDINAVKNRNAAQSLQIAKQFASKLKKSNFKNIAVLIGTNDLNRWKYTKNPKQAAKKVSDAIFAIWDAFGEEGLKVFGVTLPPIDKASSTINEVRGYVNDEIIKEGKKRGIHIIDSCREHGKGGVAKKGDRNKLFGGDGLHPPKKAVAEMLEQGIAEGINAEKGKKNVPTGKKKR